MIATTWSGRAVVLLLIGGFARYSPLVRNVGDAGNLARVERKLIRLLAQQQLWEVPTALAAVTYVDATAAVSACSRYGWPMERTYNGSHERGRRDAAADSIGARSPVYRSAAGREVVLAAYQAQAASNSVRGRKRFRSDVVWNDPCRVGWSR